MEPLLNLSRVSEKTLSFFKLPKFYIMKFTLLTTFLLLILACTKIPEDKGLQISINLDNENDSTNDLFKKIEIIQLETKEESLIQRIGKIIEYKSKIYILDRHQKTIFLFDSSGNFISKINTIGRAPDEYILLEDITINKFSETLECLDPMGKILSYDLNGKYLSSIYLPHPPMAYHVLTILNSDSILLHTEAGIKENYTFRIYSRKRDSIISEFGKRQETIFWKTQNPIQIYANSIFYSQAIYNTIYHIQKDTIIPAYTWDFGKYKYDLNEIRIPDLTDPTMQMKFYTEVMYSPKIPYTFWFNGQNDQYYYCSIFTKEKMINIFYDKTSKRKIVFPNGKEKIGIFPISIDNEKIIGIIDDDWMPLSFLENAMKINLINEFSIKNLPEDLNPILIKYIFK